MGLNYKNLDAETRKYMLEEIEIDVKNNTIYRSSWLTDTGSRNWPELLSAAAKSGNDDSLASELRKSGQIREKAERKKPKGGGMVTYSVPSTAPDTMAGEFNMYYLRALCRRAIANNIPHLIIYRARESDEPRPESEAMIGQKIDAKATLDDLRATHGTKASLGFPPGPNSGLTAMLP
jgi:hypothetical protein